MEVVALPGVPITTPTDGEEMVQLYEVGEFVAEVVKLIGAPGDEQTFAGPIIGFITGI